MSEDIECPPDWLARLEKPKSRKLAHEFGAGAPCTSCCYCPGLELHFWRKVCSICGCHLDDHSVEDERFPQYEALFGERKVRKAAAYFDTIFDWVPATDDPDLIAAYMESLPEKWRPVSDTYGSIYRRKQLKRQLPEYDINPTLYAAWTGDEIKGFEKYQAVLKYQAAGKGTLHKLQELENDGIYRAKPIMIVSPGTSEEMQKDPFQAEMIAVKSLPNASDQSVHCNECKAVLSRDDVVIRAAHMGHAFWHPKCFLCATCQELLVDLHYFHHNGKIYCGRDYAEAVNKKRCLECDEIIFEKEYTCANGHFYHLQHFCCKVCKETLAGMQFMHKIGSIMCLSCYEKEFVKKCEKCGDSISPFDQRLQIGGKVYHKDPACFICYVCGMGLQGKDTFLQKNHIVCRIHASTHL